MQEWGVRQSKEKADKRCTRGWVTVGAGVDPVGNPLRDCVGHTAQ